MIRSRLPAAVAAALAWGLLLVASVAGAGTLAVTPPSGSPGQLLTASGTGVAGGQQVTLQWDGNTTVGQGSSGADGSFSIQFAIPTNATPGGHQLRACIRSDCSIAPPFTVAVTTAPVSAPPSATPAPTGEASSSPAPSGSPGSSAPPSAEPSAVASESPSAAGSPSASDAPSGVPSPAASASAAIVAPTRVPTAVPAPPGPDPFSRVKIALPRLLVVAGVVGLMLLGLYVVLERRSASGSGPQLMQVASKGTHAPEDGSSPSVGDTPITETGEVPPTKDVKVKGKKIGEN